MTAILIFCRRGAAQRSGSTGAECSRCYAVGSVLAAEGEDGHGPQDSPECEGRERDAVCVRMCARACACVCACGVWFWEQGFRGGGGEVGDRGGKWEIGGGGEATLTRIMSLAMFDAVPAQMR